MHSVWHGKKMQSLTLRYQIPNFFISGVYTVRTAPLKALSSDKRWTAQLPQPVCTVSAKPEICLAQVENISKRPLQAERLQIGQIKIHVRLHSVAEDQVLQSQAQFGRRLLLHHLTVHGNLRRGGMRSWSSSRFKLGRSNRRPRFSTISALGLYATFTEMMMMASSSMAWSKSCWKAWAAAFVHQSLMCLRFFCSCFDCSLYEKYLWAAPLHPNLEANLV